MPVLKVLVLMFLVGACGAPARTPVAEPRRAEAEPATPLDAEERIARAHSEVDALFDRWWSDSEDAEEEDFDPTPHVEWLTPSVALVWRQVAHVEEMGDEARPIAEGFQARFVGADGPRPAPSSLFVSHYTTTNGHFVAYEMAEPNIDRREDVDPAIAIVAPAEIVVLDEGASAPLLIIDPSARAVPLRCTGGIVVGSTACGVALGCGTFQEQVLGVVRGAQLSTDDACIADLVAIGEAVGAARERARRRAAEFYASRSYASPLPPQCPAPPTARRHAARDRIAHWMADEGPELPVPFGELWRHVNFSCSTPQGAFGVRLVADDRDVAVFWVDASGSPSSLFDVIAPEVTAATTYVDLDGDGTREWVINVNVAAVSADGEESNETHVVSRFGPVSAEGALVPIETAPGRTVLVELAGTEGAMPARVWRFDGATGQIVDAPADDPLAQRVAAADAVDARAEDLLETLWTGSRRDLAALELTSALRDLGVPPEHASSLQSRLRARMR